MLISLQFDDFFYETYRAATATRAGSGPGASPASEAIVEAASSEVVDGGSVVVEVPGSTWSGPSSKGASTLGRILKKS